MAAADGRHHRACLPIPQAYRSRGPSVPLLIAIAVIWLATGGVQASSSSASSVVERRRSLVPSRHQSLAAAAATSRQPRDARHSSDSRTAAQNNKHFRQPSNEVLFDPDSVSSSRSSPVQLTPSWRLAQRRNSMHSIEGRDLQAPSQTARSSRRKKLKADVFYAMRGRRRFERLQDDHVTEDVDAVDDDQQWIGTETKAIDGQTDSSDQGVDGTWEQSVAPSVKDEEDDDGNQRSKDKREPPNGFHAIRGKRHMHA